MPESSGSRLQSASRRDSLSLRAAPLAIGAMMAPDSGRFRFGIRDTSATKVIPLLQPRGFVFHSQNVSWRDSLKMNSAFFLEGAMGNGSSRFKLSAHDTTAKKDTLLLLSKDVRDSLARADSIRRIPRDSTARVAQFLPSDRFPNSFLF